MDERYLLLLTKIAVMLVLFPLCQFGSEFEIQSFAMVSPYDEFPLNPYARKRGIGGGSALSPREAFSLESLTSSLEMMPELSISTSFCDNQLSTRSINIRCSFIDSGWHITNISIENSRLTGIISRGVANLPYLQRLDLSNNKLHGSIPDELGKLSNLLVLDLSGNQLTGKIPLRLGNLKNLKQLYLGQNFLTDTIPPSLGSLSSLEVLILSVNELSGGIPRELGDLSQLQILALTENGLNGSLPPELGKLSNLQQLWLTSNNLNGPLPKDYEKLVNLEVFDLGANNFSGSIPEYITYWNLTYLNLMGNNFQGPLPQGIFNMTSLHNLMVTDLNGPEFSFPESANLENIYTLMMRNCNLRDEIPAYIANWNSTLRNLDLSFNNLSGGVPNEFKNLVLYRLFLTGNKLSGPFPDWIYEIIQTSGDVTYNEFMLPNLQQNNPKEFLYNNSKFVRNPDRRYTNLEPRNENFTKEFMDQHCPHKKSKHYSLFINSGGEKITIGKNHYEADTSTSRFNVSETNKWAYSCNGDFFSTTTNSSDFVKNATCAVSLNTQESPLLANARLCPQTLTYYGFCFHNGEYTVKLHFSEIVFTADEDHSSSGKRLFDIYSQGNLKWKDFNIKEDAKGGRNNDPSINFTVKVEEHLLEIKLYFAGKGSLYNPPALHGPLISAISVTPNFKVGGLSTLEIVGIVIAAVLALLLLLALSWRLGWLGDRELRVNTVKLRGKTYKLKQVKDATGNFSPRNVIGQGRFGTVYKAVLPDQSTVAVKKLSLRSEKVINQIRTEVYTMKTLKHENIVELLDGYSKGDLHWLIYEYMEKGSLQRALFEENSTTPLDWPTRVSICLGAAKGLMYLHEDDSSRKIVHRNIKPSNVLLDGNRKAKISDLGLAKLYDEENPYKFIQEEGTVAYMAPEYAMRKAITDKVDVYSFGIIMLEIVSGESNTKFEGNQETIFLLNRAIVLHSNGTLNDLVDKNMPNIDLHARTQAIKILELAVKCVDQSHNLRPTMSQVVSELEQISNRTRSG